MKQDRINEYPIPKTMKAWVLGDREELTLVEKPVPEPGSAEVLVRVDAIAVCATDIEIIKHGLPAMIDGGLPFNRGFTPGHEYMGTVVRLGPTVDDSGSAIASPSRCMPDAAAASAAAKACTPRASITGTPRRGTAPTASAPMAASPNTRSTTSTRWFMSPKT
jgi:D-arabinose 1-dehydrogenase-like Zn-dependent alcohol dehydrogenase